MPSTNSPVAQILPVDNPAQAVDPTVQVGGVQMDQAMYDNRVGEVRGDYASALSDINSKFADLSANIQTIQNGISGEISSNKRVARNAYNGMMSELSNQITNIQHVQNVQVTQSASQLDSMLASGQFGGNVYRSQQVFAMNMSNIISSSMKNVSDVALQYRTSAEQLQNQYSAQQLSAYMNGAGIVLGAMTDLAKTYAMVRSDLTVNKNNQLNDLYKVKTNLDIANAQMATNERIATMQADVQKLVTQWQIDASYRETQLKIELQDRQIASAELIAQRNNELQRDLANQKDKLQRDLQSYDSRIQKELQTAEIAYKKDSQEKQLALQRELGIADLNVKYTQIEESARINAARQKAEDRQAQAMNDFNQQMSEGSAQMISVLESVKKLAKEAENS